jgi:hypothetical protein
MYRFTAPVTISALAAAAEEELTITETRNGKCRLGDGIVINPPTGAEAGLAVVAAWVHAPGVIKFRISNLNASTALTAGAVNFTVTVLR